MPTLAKRIPAKRLHVNFSCSITIPSIATVIIPPALTIGATVETPGPSESDLKKNVVKSETQKPPIMIKVISPAFGTAFRLKSRYNIIAVRNAAV